MSRRADPERIYQMQRDGVFARLTRHAHLDELDAEHWLARWEREAESNGPARGARTYWDAAWTWITEQRSIPLDDATKTDMSAVGDDGQVFGG